MLVVFGICSREHSVGEPFGLNRSELVANVTSGCRDVLISDAKLLEMLLDAPLCRENVTSIFFMVDLGDLRFRRVSEFPNFIVIGFYDCRNAGNVISVAKDLPTVESLFFEVTENSPRSMQSLAGFANLKKVHCEQVMPDAKTDELNELLPHVDVQTPWAESKEPEF